MNRTTIIGAALALACALAAPHAWAHAHLVKAIPAAGSDAPPTATLTLAFSEGVEVKFCKVEIKMDGGQDAGPAKLDTGPDDKKTLIVTLPAPLAPGHYRLTWQVVSEDSHKSQGGFDFTVTK